MGISLHLQHRRLFVSSQHPLNGFVAVKMLHGTQPALEDGRHDHQKQGIGQGRFRFPLQQHFQNQTKLLIFRPLRPFSQGSQIQVGKEHMVPVHGGAEPADHPPQLAQHILHRVFRHPLRIPVPDGAVVGQFLLKILGKGHGSKGQIFQTLPVAPHQAHEGLIHQGLRRVRIQKVLALAPAQFPVVGIRQDLPAEAAAVHGGRGGAPVLLDKIQRQIAVHGHTPFFFSIARPSPNLKRKSLILKQKKQNRFLKMVLPISLK